MKMFSYTKPAPVCAPGKEQFDKFNAAPRSRPEVILYRYDYTDEKGNTFSCVGHSEEYCRKQREKWEKETKVPALKLKEI